MKKLLAAIVLPFVVAKTFNPFFFVTAAEKLGIEFAATMPHGEFQQGGTRLMVTLYDVRVASTTERRPWGDSTFHPGHEPLAGLNDPVMISSYTATLQAAIKAAGG